MIFYLNKVFELYWTIFYYIFKPFIFSKLGKGCRFEGWIDITQRSGCIEIGNFVRVRKNVEFTVPKSGKLIIQDGVFIGSGVVISAHGNVSIGTNCLIAEYVCIHDNNHAISLSNLCIVAQGFNIGSCVIGRNSWVGAGSKLLMNSSIGPNSVLGAGSVLTKSLGSDVVAGGVPAAVIKKR